MGRETAEQKAERIAAETAAREAAESAAADQAATDAAEIAEREAAEAAAAEQAAKDAEAVAEREAAEAAAAEQAAKDAAAAAGAADGDDRDIVVATMRINGTILCGTLMAPSADELAELRALGAVRDATEDEKAVYRLSNPLVDPDLIV